MESDVAKSAAKTLKKLKRELLADKAVSAAYDEQAPEYATARAVIKARRRVENILRPKT